jgi:general secretion pathway protein D
VKTLLLILALATAPVWAQIPPPSTSGPAAPAEPAPPGTAPDNTVVAITPSQKSNLSEAALNRLYGKDEINFSNVEINQFLTVYADLVNRTILRPSTLPAPTITLRNQTPITRREAIQLFDAVLGINGIAIINVGEKFAKAVPVAQANQEGAPFNRGTAASLPDMGTYVTHVVQLKYVRPSEIVPVLQPFAKIPNSILPIEANGILVIRDYAENVKRMLEMIAQVDVSVPAEFISEVIPIKYALASDIASALNSLSGGGGGGATTGGAGATGARGTQRGFGAGRSTMGVSGVGTPGGTTTTPQGALGTPAAPGAAGGSSFTDRLRSIISKASQTTGTGDFQIIGTNKIIADERTNSLLVYASRQDMATIKDVISKLDVVLAQVLIESIILGVTGNTDLELGVSAAQKPKQISQNVQGAGVMNNDKDFLGTGQSFLQNIIVSNATSAVPAIGGLNYFGQINQDWLVAIKALSSSAKTEVLQRPVIMTTHATPGSFFVGNTVPYVTSSYYGGGIGGYGPSSSYQQLRVGIQLTVTPFINPDGIVVMKIDQAIDQISGSTFIQGVGDVPNTASRTLSADITVRDRDTIVLGGFISTDATKTKSGVPVLKDIPLLGALFSSTSDTKDRQELLVLMRPSVLKTPELAAVGSRIEKSRMSGIRKFENGLDKEFGEYDKEMDKLDGIKSKDTHPGVPPQTKAGEQQPGLLNQTAPSNPIAPAPAPVVSPAPTPAAQNAQPAQTQPPASQAQTKAAPQTKPAKDTKTPFDSVQPMTEEEKKAYGRLPENN